MSDEQCAARGRHRHQIDPTSSLVARRSSLIAHRRLPGPPRRALDARPHAQPSWCCAARAMDAFAGEYGAKACDQSSASAARRPSRTRLSASPGFEPYGGLRVPSGGGRPFRRPRAARPSTRLQETVDTCSLGSCGRSVGHTPRAPGPRLRPRPARHADRAREDRPSPNRGARTRDSAARGRDARPTGESCSRHRAGYSDAQERTDRWPPIPRPPARG